MAIIWQESSTQAPGQYVTISLSTESLSVENDTVNRIPIPQGRYASNESPYIVIKATFRGH